MIRELQVLWFFLALLSLPFVYYHFAFMLNADSHARDARIHHERLQSKAQSISEYTEENGQYPDACWLNDCGNKTVWAVFWKIEQNNGKGFTVHYDAPGVMFAPVGSLGNRKYWLNTETDKFSHDDKDEFIDVAIPYAFHLFLSLIPMLLFLASFMPIKKR